MRAKGHSLCALLLILAMASSALAQGQQGISGGDSDSSPVMIDIEDFSFLPPTVTIAVGDKVEWTNLDDASHAIIGGTLDSGTLLTGSTYEFTFTEPGEFAYACSLHPAMEGKVIVVADGAAIAPSTDKDEFLGDEARYDIPFEEGHARETALNDTGTDAFEQSGSEPANPTLLLAEDAGLPAWAYAFMVFFGFALLAGIVLVFMLHGKRVLPAISATPRTDVPVELRPALDYVRTARARGMDDEQIKASFSRQGWSAEQIEMMYHFL